MTNHKITDCAQQFPFFQRQVSSENHQNFQILWQEMPTLTVEDVIVELIHIESNFSDCQLLKTKFRRRFCFD